MVPALLMFAMLSCYICESLPGFLGEQTAEEQILKACGVDVDIVWPKLQEEGYKNKDHWKHVTDEEINGWGWKKGTKVAWQEAKKKNFCKDQYVQKQDKGGAYRFKSEQNKFTGNNYGTNTQSVSVGGAEFIVGCIVVGAIIMIIIYMKSGKDLKSLTNAFGTNNDPNNDPNNDQKKDK